MKDVTKKKAPRVAVAPKKKPFQFFRESDKMRRKGGSSTIRKDLAN
jgi:preprotein translocase subunit SecE